MGLVSALVKGMDHERQTKDHSAVVGGYLLGRTRKGSAALKLAFWLSGHQTGHEAVRHQGVLR